MKSYTDVQTIQKMICKKYGAKYVHSPLDMKVGISRNFRITNEPIHGLRHPIEGDTTGWYIWCGEFSSDPDFFIPLHVGHLNDYSKLLLPYLGLAPGWRFLLDNEGYEDVWEDLSLLEI